MAVMLLLVLLRLTEPGARLLPESVIWTGLRSLLLALMWIAYYLSLPHIQLSVAAAIYYTSPLFIALLSSWIANERPGFFLWLATATGFTGVLVIVRPDTGEFNAYVLLPLLAAALYAVAMVITRTRCQRENPKVLSLVLNVTFIVIGLIALAVLNIWQPSPRHLADSPFLYSGWSPLSLLDWMVMLSLALVIVVGSWFAAIAYQRGKPSVVAVFDYSYLIFSAMWGLLLFREIPDLSTMGGILLIALAGFLSIRFATAVP